MTLRHLAAAVIAVGALVTTSAPASATCYVANIDICDLPTDPITEPIVDDVFDTVPAPVWGAVGTASQVVVDVYSAALCVVDPSYSWC